MWCGTLKAQQKRLGLERPSTFESPQDLSQTLGAGAATAFGDSGSGRPAPGDYPVIAITPQGWAAMKGEAPIRLVLPRCRGGRRAGISEEKTWLHPHRPSVRVTNHTLSNVCDR